MDSLELMMIIMMKLNRPLQGINGSSGAVQRGADDTRDYRPLGLRVHGRQRSHIRHLQAATLHRTAVVRQPK